MTSSSDPRPPRVDADAAHSRARWARIPTKEERAGELEAAERAARREARIDTLRAGVLVLCCLALGLGAMGWALHTTDQAMGEVVFLAGVIAANVGILAVWVWRYHRARDRGEL